MDERAESREQRQESREQRDVPADVHHAVNGGRATEAFAAGAGDSFA
jgi:hypothetical protein